MLVTEQSNRGTVALAKDEVAGEREARRPPGGNEDVGFVPAVKADAECSVFEKAEHLGESGREPCVVVVVDDAAAVARAIVHEIRRIGENEVDAFGLEAAHQRDAVAVQNGVE